MVLLNILQILYGLIFRKMTVSIAKVVHFLAVLYDIMCKNYHWFYRWVIFIITRIEMPER